MVLVLSSLASNICHSDSSVQCRANSRRGIPVALATRAVDCRCNSDRLRISLGNAYGNELALVEFRVV